MGFMKPNVVQMPAPPPPVPVPTIDQTAVAGEQASEELRNRKGRASTVLSGNDTRYQGGEANVQTAAKALLGS